MERERIPRGIEPRRHLKMGPGGTADVEFAVQLLQIHNGWAIEGVRTPATLDALAAARAEGIITARDAQWLDDAYRFVTRLRNRLFLLVGRPTDVLPATQEGLEALGIAMGYDDQPRQEVEEEYLRVTRRARRVARELIYG
jgi:glutamate-ammonia-ligase adenylyltransferase